MRASDSEMQCRTRALIGEQRPLLSVADSGLTRKFQGRGRITWPSQFLARYAGAVFYLSWCSSAVDLPPPISCTPLFPPFPSRPSYFFSLFSLPFHRRPSPSGSPPSSLPHPPRPPRLPRRRSILTALDVPVHFLKAIFRL